MRPPACAVCGDEFEAPKGRLVTFAERDSDRQWRVEAAASGMVGHPPNIEWFCGQHADAATALASSTIDVALAAVRVPAVGLREVRPLPEIVRVPSAPVTIDTLLALFRDRMPALVGDDTAVATTTTERTWSPMDGSYPPHCPFDDVDTTTMSGPLGTVRLEWDRAMWNEESVARNTVTLVVEPVGGERCSISATVGQGFTGSQGDSATELLVLGQPHSDVQHLIDEIAG